VWASRAAQKKDGATKAISWTARHPIRPFA
jgi:hypothetical protein